MKKRLFAVLLFGLFVLGGVWTGKGIFAAAAQGGASRDEAVKMEMGDTIKGKVSADVAEQWYSFKTEKDKEYWYHFDYLTIDGTSARVTLYDEDFQEKGTISSDLGASLEMSFKLTPSSTCYICIRRSGIYGATDESEFKLKTSKALDDAADTMGKAYTELISGKKYDFKLDNRADEDYFYFTAGADTTKVAVGGDIPKGITWYVYDEDKNQLKSVLAAQDETKTIEVATKKGKKYYVYVTGIGGNIFGSELLSGNYTVKVDSGSKPDSEIMFTVTLKKGDTLKLDAVLQPSGKKAAKTTWKSSKKTVAKVDSKGKVTAVKKGSAIITVTAGDLTGKIKVTVTE